MFNIIENNKVIHSGKNKEAVEKWAFILTNTQGRKVKVEYKPV